MEFPIFNIVCDISTTSITFSNYIRFGTNDDNIFIATSLFNMSFQKFVHMCIILMSPYVI
jgi:hypothetical protein